MHALRPYFLLLKLVVVTLPLAVGLVVYEGIPFLLDGRVDKARQEGATAERAAWEEAQRMLRLENARKLANAQAEIDHLETEFLNSRTDQALKITALEKALSEATDGEEDPACAAHPAIPRGVSRALDAIGR